MKTIDRLILGALVVGIWALVAIQLTSNTPAYATSIVAGDIVGLEAFVKNVIKDCYIGYAEPVIYCR